MSESLLAVVAVLLVGAFTSFVGRLVWMVLGGAWVVSRASREARRAQERFRRNLRTQPTAEIRAELLADPYFDERIRAEAPVAEFLARVSRGDEAMLRAQYPERRLYSMLAGAERAAGHHGRPEAIDAIGEIFSRLEELARR